MFYVIAYLYIIEIFTKCSDHIWPQLCYELEVIFCSF